MEFTFLGTSAGTPSKARNVTGLALQHGGSKSWYLIDCGEGTQPQLLRTRYTLHQLQAIFITHVHGDHTLGLPGLLSSASMAGRSETLPIIAPAPVRDFIESALQATDSSLGFALDFVEWESPDFCWRDAAIEVSSVPLSHRVPCKAFVFTETNLERRLLTDKLQAHGIEAGPAWGELQRGLDVQLPQGGLLRSADYTRIPRRPRRLIVAGDNDSPALLAEACEDSQVLIHETTYTQEVADKVGPSPQHSSAAQVAQFAQSLALPNLVLTHFSPRYQLLQGAGPCVEELAEEARRHYTGQLFLARDLATFQLDKDRKLSLLSGSDQSGPSISSKQQDQEES